MFLITGDVHADINDFRSRKFGRIKKEDMVIVCGDFGVLWDGSKQEQKNMKSLAKLHHKTLFIDGAHENYDLLAKYPVTDWNGGKVQIIEGNLIHLMRGQVYTINGKKIFTFGGGESTDKEMREPHKTWWEQELPDEDEMKQGIVSLVDNDWQVDYILTHEAPSRFKSIMDPNSKNLNALTVYLDYIREKCRYKKWIFANYHKDRRISQNCEVVYENVIRLEP